MVRYRTLRELRRRLPLERRARRDRHGRSNEFAVQHHALAVPGPSTGYEIGLRNRSIAGLETSLALFRLDFASENLFQGDSGTTEPSRPTRRFGVEWTNRYAVTPWLSLEGDLTITNARFSDYDPVGNRVPEAPTTIASAGVTFGEPLGWFGSLRFRYFGPRPLIEDNAIRSRATALFNGRVGYAFETG